MADKTTPLKKVIGHLLANFEAANDSAEDLTAAWGAIEVLTKADMSWTFWLLSLGNGNMVSGTHDSFADVDAHMGLMPDVADEWAVEIDGTYYTGPIRLWAKQKATGRKLMFFGEVRLFLKWMTLMVEKGV